MKFKFILIFFILFSLPLYATKEVGNGGDSIAIEFSAIANTLLKTIDAHTDYFPEVNLQEFKRAIAETKLVSMDRVFLNDDEKDALNYPIQKKIEISRKRWLDMSEEIALKTIVVFHEYLGIIGNLDLSYNISQRLYAISSTLKVKVNGLYGTLSESCGIEIVSTYFNNIYIKFINNPLNGIRCLNSEEIIPLICMGNKCESASTLIENRKQYYGYFKYNLHTSNGSDGFFFQKITSFCKNYKSEYVSCEADLPFEEFHYAGKNE